MLENVDTTLHDVFNITKKISYNDVKFNEGNSSVSFNRNETYYYSDPVNKNLVNLKDIQNTCKDWNESNKLTVNNWITNVAIKNTNIFPEGCSIAKNHLKLNKEQIIYSCGPDKGEKYCSDPDYPYCTAYGFCVSQQHEVGATTNQNYSHDKIPDICKKQLVKLENLEDKILIKDQMIESLKECEKLKQEVYQIRPGIQRAIDQVEERSISDAFVVSYYRIFLDATDKILVNYLTGKIFYDNDYNW